MQARYYDPVIGRFYSNDPVGFTNIHTFNRYGYANNNPYKYIDPDGRETRMAQRMDIANRAFLAGEIDEEELDSRRNAEGIGGVIGLAVVATGGRLLPLITKQLAKRKAQNAIIKKLTKGLRKQIAQHVKKIKNERSLGTKPEMVGKTTKKQQAAQLKKRRQKHRRDIRDWKKQIKEIKRRVRNQK